MAAIKQLYDVFADKWLGPGKTIWVFSDPHFNDPDSKYFRGDSYPGDEELVQRINSKVGKHDIIIFLGDIGDVSYIKKVKGYKVLIMGNHDKGVSNYKREIKYVLDNKNGKHEIDSNLYRVEDNRLFDEVYEGPLFIGPKLLLSHEPIDYPFAYNIHGHIHGELIKDELHANMCAEHIDYMPQRLSDIIQQAHLGDIRDIHRATIDNAIMYSLRPKE